MDPIPSRDRESINSNYIDPSQNLYWRAGIGMKERVWVEEQANERNSLSRNYVRVCYD